MMPFTMNQDLLTFFLSRMDAVSAHAFQGLLNTGHASQGQRVLFCGPPGSGKKRAVRWLAEQVGAEVIRIDVSAYIGETEKNLQELLQHAHASVAVLLFDEADALFGKRVAKEQEAHDKYANQEVSYLRQVFDSHPGLVVVVTREPLLTPVLWLREFDKVVVFKPTT